MDSLSCGLSIYLPFYLHLQDDKSDEYDNLHGQPPTHTSFVCSQGESKNMLKSNLGLRIVLYPNVNDTDRDDGRSPPMNG